MGCWYMPGRIIRSGRVQKEDSVFCLADLRPKEASTGPTCLSATLSKNDCTSPGPSDHFPRCDSDPLWFSWTASNFQVRRTALESNRYRNEHETIQDKCQDRATFILRFLLPSKRPLLNQILDNMILQGSVVQLCFTVLTLWNLPSCALLIMAYFTCSEFISVQFQRYLKRAVILEVIRICIRNHQQFSVF